jgi:hypothetical protein
MSLKKNEDDTASKNATHSSNISYQQHVIDDDCAATSLQQSYQYNDTQNTYTEIQIDGIRFEDYIDESQLDHVMSLVGQDLSEPYSSK